MESLTWGILTIIACFTGFFFAWKCFRAGKYSTTLLLILCCGLLLRFYVASDPDFHTWDERYHALVAKNLIQDPLKPTLYKDPVLPYKYKNWIGNHIWLEKGPVPLWGMATSIKIFGINELAVRLPSLIISTLAIFITFLIGYKLFDERVGLLAAFFHAINGLAIEMAGGRVSSDHVETAFVFYTELAVLLCILSILHKKAYLFSALTGICIGLAILSKWAPALIVFPVWLVGAFLSKRFNLGQIFKLGLLMFVCCLATFLPWIFFILNAYPQEANWVLQKFIYAYSDTVEGHAAPAYYYLQQMALVFGELIFLPIILSLYFLIKQKADWRLWMLNLWWIIPVIIFSLADTKRHTYMLIFAPALFIIGAYFWFYLLSKKENFRFPKLITVALILIIALPVRYSIEVSKALRKREEPEWSKQIKTLKDKIPPTQRPLVFNTDHYVEGMFYSGLTIYQNVPGVHEVDSLQQQGFTVFIIDDGKIDDRFSSNKEVKFIKLEE